MSTSVRLITNSTADNHWKAISADLRSSDNITICVAFLKKSGLDLLKSALFAAVARGANVRVIAGLDLYLTDPDALKELFDRFGDRKNASLLVSTSNNPTFHPKIYYWEKSNQAHIVVGSANATKGGIVDNTEASIAYVANTNSEIAKEVRSFFTLLVKQKRIELADPVALSQYRRRYGVYAAKRKKAEKEAATEAKGIYSVDTKLLKAYLQRYKTNGAEQMRLKEKRTHYRLAKQELDALANGKTSGKADFLKRYERLVGKKGGGALWHSGSLFRSKAKVASRHKRFIEMVRAIKANIKRPAAALFDVALDHAMSIDGIGVNVITEILNTYAPRRFAVLNKNPTKSLEHLGFERFGSLNKAVFKGDRYEMFNSLLQDLASTLGFDNLSDVDHFLNFVYWNYVKKDRA